MYLNITSKNKYNMSGESLVDYGDEETPIMGGSIIKHKLEIEDAFKGGLMIAVIILVLVYLIDLLGVLNVEDISGKWSTALDEGDYILPIGMFAGFAAAVGVGLYYISEYKKD